MTARRAFRAIALFGALLLAGESAAQGILDLFGPDRPAARAAPRPARDVPRSEKKKPEASAKKRGGDARANPAKPASAKPETASAEAPPAPYEPQLLRLSEVLGALAFLRDLCGAGDGEDWRGKMSALVDAEAPNGPRRAAFVGAFNKGFRGFEFTYRRCTPNARAATARYLEEAAAISRDVTYRFGSP